MPELPEVETIVRGLRQKIKANQIIKTSILRQRSLVKGSLDPQILVNQEIIDVERRGKLIVLKCQNKDDKEPYYFIVHLRMTGALLLKEAADQPDIHTKLTLTLKDSLDNIQQLFFHDIRGFGQIFVTKESGLNKWSFWQNLGPEPLSLELDTFKEILQKFKGKAIKALLLDQGALAGIGNIYADESLFKAKLNPKRKAGSLNESEIANLLAAIKENLTTSIENGGTTFRNYQDVNGQHGHNQEHLLVYGRGGEKCPVCGHLLEKITVAGRGTVICQHCQK
ncbi:MAG: bifunctional DNA-formamidopyrimidine glycosylase/DNA-(apurinic or apyrimidinic site) lyase [Desulfovibrionaceae bacterium]|nr:bifunctional DNA-formamidopyrimidine glycosylase/DNA-(apurinic or apyrimidinic site) lyase [Desulfovibrionaceae bacterium]